MAFNLKDDWEQAKRSMAEVVSDIRYDNSCQGWNNEMTDLVNAYKREEMEWYNSPNAIENGFRTATQNLWYSHYLSKMRLRSLGLRTQCDKIKPTEYARRENSRYPSWRYGHDGRNLICRVSDSFRYKKAFLDQNRLVFMDQKNGEGGEYYIIQPRSMNGNYICPNCGWEERLEYFVDGCDYCSTKFQIDDLRQKVSSVYNPGDWKQHRDGFTIHKNFMPLYIILVIFSFGLIVAAGRMGAGMMMLTPVLGFVAIVIFLAAVLGKTSKESIEGGPAKTRRTLDKIRDVDKNFSQEAFIGNIFNKITSICYAERMEDILPFVMCDMTAFMQANRNVFDCRLLECVLMDYQAAGNFQHLKIRVKFYAAYYENGIAGVRTEHVGFSLIKSVDAVNRSISDVNVYRCHSCGASLSLLNGGKCEYCGNTLDLKEYDWVIDGYEFIQ